MTKASTVSADQVSNDAEIHFASPYRVEITVQGAADFLFHRFSTDDYEVKGAAAKGSTTKKTDNVEAYVYRTRDGFLGIPGEYLRQSIITSAKFQQDPRSPRKSAMDLFKAGIVTLTDVASLGTKEWDYLDRRRAQIQRAAVIRTRPAMQAGYSAAFVVQVLVPEYISPTFLNQVVAQAGRLIGIGDFRPTFGRFVVTGFNVLDD